MRERRKQREVAEATRLAAEAGQLHARGDWPGALSRYERVLALARKLGDLRAVGGALNAIGDIRREQGQLLEAFEPLAQALIIVRQLGDRRTEGAILNNIAMLSRDLGKRDDAIKLFEQALTIAREVGDERGQTVIQSNLAKLR